MRVSLKTVLIRMAICLSPRTSIPTPCTPLPLFPEHQQRTPQVPGTVRKDDTNAPTKEMDKGIKKDRHRNRQFLVMVVNMEMSAKLSEILQ